MKPRQPLSIFISHPSHFLTDSEPHGDGLLAWEFIRRLAARNHQLHVAVPLMKLEQALPPNIHLHPVASFTRPSRVNPPPLNRLEYAVRVRFLLRRLLRRVRLDLIHQLNPVVPGMSLFLPGLGLPIVLGPFPPHVPEQWDEDSPSATGERRSFSHILRDYALHRQFRDAEVILIPTAKSLDEVPTDPGIRHKVRQLNYGIDTDRFRPDASHAPAIPIILYLANLIRRKGILQLIEAFELVAADHPSAILLIAGAGDDEAEVKQRVAKSPCAARIRLTGNVPRESVPAMLNGCSVYCLPSYCEPFGMTALEAMACGKPVIGTKSGGLGFLLDDSGAFRVAPGDVNGLASSLRTVLSSRSLSDTMGTHNRQRVVSEFAWEVIIDQLEQIYSGVLATRQQVVMLPQKEVSYSS